MGKFKMGDKIKPIKKGSSFQKGRKIEIWAPETTEWNVLIILQIVYSNYSILVISKKVEIWEYTT